MDNHIRPLTLDYDKYTELMREAAADGIVLLKNDPAVLPLAAGAKVALFGRGQLFYYKSGTGSGGMVHAPYVTGIGEALASDPAIELDEPLAAVYRRWNEENPPVTGEGWGQDPWSQAEMPLTDELCAQAARRSDTALVVIGRTAGEDRDNGEEEGSYLLTETEKEMLRKVRTAFSRMAVLLNTGNLIDMSFVEEIGPDAVLLCWQGGMVGGLGVADVLTGRVTPSGHLTDTIARSVHDYPSDPNFGGGLDEIYQEDIYVGYRYFESVAPEKVLYPFGFGLSYTTFAIEASREEFEEKDASGRLTADLRIIVRNTGERAGRCVVQVYASCPQGKLGKSTRTLAEFAKTGVLTPGASEEIRLRIPVRSFASYDDGGVTGNRSCWVLEEGRYDLYVGENVRDAVCVTASCADGAFTVSDTWPTRQEEEALAPVQPFRRLVLQAEDPLSNVPDRVQWQDAPLQAIDEAKRRRDNMPPELEYTGDLGIRLRDVKDETSDLESFIAQLSDEDLCAIVRGEGMGSVKVTPGTASAFGGVTKSLAAFGIPAACCDDGPSGMRLDCGDMACSLPSGTALACTFDRNLNERLFACLGLEMRAMKVDCLLGPGINIHRHPLCGRNFEYFSEDPFLTGHIAAAQLRGLHAAGVTGVIKHFCANNREKDRSFINSVVSERALREIYLRGFEIAVREGRADAVMTSYGRVNGLQTSTNYDLTTTILRDAWGFDGIVMTDWWSTVSSLRAVTARAGMAGTAPDEAGVKLDQEERVAALEGAKRGHLYDLSPMVQAQNDLYMVVPDGEKIAPGPGEAPAPSTRSRLESGELERAELQRNAANICRFLLSTPAMLRLVGEEPEIELLHVPKAQEARARAQVPFVRIDEEKGLVFSMDGADTKRGAEYSVGVEFPKVNRLYKATLRAAAGGSALAQIPVTLFDGETPVGTMTFAGQQEATDHSLTFFTVTGRSVLRLYFGEGGLEPVSLTVELADEDE